MITLSCNRTPVTVSQAVPARPVPRVSVNRRRPRDVSPVDARAARGMPGGDPAGFVRRPFQGRSASATVKTPTAHARGRRLACDWLQTSSDRPWPGQSGEMAGAHRRTWPTTDGRPHVSESGFAELWRRFRTSAPSDSEHPRPARQRHAGQSMEP